MAVKFAAPEFVAIMVYIIRMKRISLILLTIAQMVAANCIFCAVYGASPEKAWTASPVSIELVMEKIRTAKIVDPASPLSFSVKDGVANIQCWRRQNATDTDCKIDAVLIAKEIFDVAREHIQSVVLNFEVPHKLDVVTVPVTKEEVKDFGSGEMTRKALLDVVTVEKGKRIEPPRAMIHDNVAPYKGREVLYKTLIALDGKDASVEPCVELYKTMESAVARNDEDAAGIFCAGCRSAIAALARNYNHQLAERRASEISDMNKSLHGLSAEQTTAKMKEYLGTDVPPPGPEYLARLSVAYWIKWLDTLGFAQYEAQRILADANSTAQRNDKTNTEKMMGFFPEDGKMYGRW